jgi:hypothetical protein
MYSDNHLFPDDSPFDWSGWGAVHGPKEEGAEAGCPGSSVVGWREGVASVVTAAGSASETQE